MKSIKTKLYIFIITVVLIVATSAFMMSYIAGAHYLDRLYKNMTTANALNFSTTLDGDYFRDLCTLLRTDEYQELRAKAAEEDNDELIQQYLEEHGMWEQYADIRTHIATYIKNTQDIKYLYVVAHEDINATEDMFLTDDPNETLYDSAGRYEEREAEFLGQDLIDVEPTISYSDEWGWLCSDYAPIYDSNGDVVALVGCDVDYTAMANAKQKVLVTNITIISIISAILIVVSLIIVNRHFIKPLKLIADEVTKFNPTGDTMTSGIISLNMDKREDEIGQIYNNIRGNQFDIVDYVRNITNMREDLDEKDTRISKLSVSTFKDALTSVGNRGAYLKKLKELDASNDNYAIVMIDINNLKQMNDTYGHRAGDWYIQGCCKLICDTFAHSPVFRIGGDEFVIVVEKQDYVDRQDKFEELEKAFEISYQKETSKPWERLSASCGIAEKSADDYSTDFVFKRADEMMYQSKAKFKEKYGSYR